MQGGSTLKEDRTGDIYPKGPSKRDISQGCIIGAHPMCPRAAHPRGPIQEESIQDVSIQDRPIKGCVFKRVHLSGSIQVDIRISMYRYLRWVSGQVSGDLGASSLLLPHRPAGNRPAGNCTTGLAGCTAAPGQRHCAAHCCCPAPLAGRCDAQQPPVEGWDGTPPHVPP